MKENWKTLALTAIVIVAFFGATGWMIKSSNDPEWEAAVAEKQDSMPCLSLVGYMNANRSMVRRVRRP